MKTLSGSPSRLLGLAVLSFFTLWSGWFIYRSSFVADGSRHFVLFDDAMISMAYARNLAEGRGLEWAREGDPVEGFTTPLWTLAMVPVNATALPLAQRSLVVQLASLGLLVANLLLLARLVNRYFSSGLADAWLPAVVLTACYYPLSYWSLFGMETGLEALLTTAAVFLTFEIVEAGRDRAVSLAVVLALGYLTRMDMALVALAVVAYCFFHRRSGAVPRRSWLFAGLILLGTVLGYQLFRLLYFGDPLPNTYYLKLTGIPLDVRLLRGLSVYADFARAHGLLLAAVVVAVLPLLRSQRRLQLPVALFALYSLYSIAVGGDAWESLDGVRANRFLAFVVPMLFVALAGVLNRATAAARIAQPLVRSARIAAVLLLTLSVNGLLFSPAAASHWNIVTAVEPPPFTASNHIVLNQLLRLERHLAPGARVATFWAGIPAYFSDYRMVDMFGYSDRHIAHLPPARRLEPGSFQAYRPGHVKWDYDYILRERAPDAFLQAWGLAKNGQSPLLTAEGYVVVGEFWIREDSLYRLRSGRGG